MSQLAASVLAPVVESGVKYVFAAIKRQLIYLCCFVTNINALKDEETKLDEAIVGVQAKVDAAKNNLQEIHPEVLSWCGASDNFKTETKTILEVKTSCLKVASRFSLSKRAVKTTEAMAKHREKCEKFVDVSLPPRSAASRPTPLGTTYEFDSRKKIEQDIMTALRDGNEKMIGICGMGGLGKTTMAKRIMNKVLEEQLFQEVVMAVVSQPVDMLKIQVEIAGSLGLKKLEKETAQARVQKLYERLTSDTKRILLVLDDVWTNLNLNELGIPCDGDPKRCTILITSRNRDTLREMDVRKVLGMESLSEEDSWFLYREKAGICVDDRKLKATAKKVVEKCRGLPIALATVGVALKDEKSLSVWKDALKQLKKANPNNTPRFIAEVYNPLVLSYDRLDSEEAKSLFLLCCLYPEDDDIEIDELTYFCMGLRTFTDVRSLEEVRDRICTLIKSLKSRSLLLDGDYRGFVRMHDVVRDVCIFIAKQKGYIGGNDCTWISSTQLPGEGTELSMELGFPNLRLVFSRKNGIKIENISLERMSELCVLSIENYSWASLPHITPSLRTLVLHICENLETIYVVGSLKNLEILICRLCFRIKELPQEIGGLMHLKLLDITSCISLESIAPGIISSLVGLEELKMMGSFQKWEGEDGERQNAGLRELESLTKLTCLEIQIADPTLAAQQINLSSKIERFRISIDGQSFYSEGFYGGRFNKMMDLRWKENICLGHWMEKLVNDTECLRFEGNGANNLDLASIHQNVKMLELDSCDSLKNIGTTSMDDDGGETLFSHMESLTLSNLPQLQKFWNGPIPSNAFQNLKEIYLSYLPVLKQLWSSNTGLPQLQSLEIRECEMMEQVIMCRQGRIEFPLLKKLSTRGCPNLRNIIATSPDNEDHYLHLFCQPQKVSFGSLKELIMERNPFCRHNNIHLPFLNKVEILYINHCRDSMSLFIPSIAKNLANLKMLTIDDCDEMVEVIEDDNEENQAGSDGERYCLFPNLLTLELRYLPKLEIFCKWKRDVELPSLTKLNVYKCPNMARFTLRSTTTPDCTSIMIDGKIYASTDLNCAVQKHYAKQQEIDGNGDSDST